MHINVSPKEYHNSLRFNKNEACTPVFFFNIKLKTYRKHSPQTITKNTYIYKTYTSQCFSKTKTAKLQIYLTSKEFSHLFLIPYGSPLSYLPSSLPSFTYPALH
jgi:hypothetical protein